MIAADVEETIAAIASAPGSSARGIVRVSGNCTVEVVAGLCGFDAESTGKTPHRHEVDIALASQSSGGQGTVSLPIALHLWPTNRSYTGQPMAELHLPGSPPLLELVLEELFKRGVRPAQRGEFTLRSFLAGRIDLTQAEAVLGVIDAFDSDELRTALKQLAGGLSGKIGEVRSVLLNVLADLEAGLDFVEEDIEFVSQNQLVESLSKCRSTISKLYEAADSRMHSAGRPKVVLAGLPNAGKSTLFNALVGNEAAIVSSEVGTTRDWLSAPVTLDGLEFDLIDTAGWENGVREISAAAQSQRQEQTLEADLVLWCSAADMSDAERALDEDRQAELHASEVQFVRITTKADCESSSVSDDLARAAASQRVESPLPPEEERVSGPGRQPSDLSPQPSPLQRGEGAAHDRQFDVSAVTGFGIAVLKARLGDDLAEQRRGNAELVGSTAARSRESLRLATDSLGRAIDAAQLAIGDELIAIEIRAALEHLGEIVGAVYTDDILDRIFSRFCIGK